MSAPAPHRWISPRASILLAMLLVFLPVLYLLSAGPAIVMYEHGLMSEKSIEGIYAPVIWLHERLPSPMRRMLEWYLELWR